MEGKNMYLKNRLRYFKENWKSCIHILFRTKHFGVNGKNWSDFPSGFGWPWYKIIWAIITIRPFIRNYKEIKIRARFGFVHPDTLKKLGWDEDSH